MHPSAGATARPVAISAGGGHNRGRQSQGQELRPAPHSFRSRSLSSDTNRHPQCDDETVTFSGTAPTKIGEYQLLRLMGAGGMGMVYEALHTRLKKRVAVKLLADAKGARRSAWRRFFREMEAIGKLEHAHVVR